MTKIEKQSQILKLPALQKWIDDQGFVDYLKLRSSKEFWKQIEIIENFDIKNATHYEKFAFWLNAYNFLTIKSILLVLEKKPNWQGNLTLLSKLKFFILQKHRVANTKMSLNTIEHQKIRRDFGDPRIHFAINCGSASCPFLPNNTFSAANLEKTLEGLTSFFINSSANVCYKEKANILYLNKIFKWYSKDFERSGGIKKFIGKYWKGPTEKLQNARIIFKKYNWALNSQ